MALLVLAPCFRFFFPLLLLMGSSRAATNVSLSFRPRFPTCCPSYQPMIHPVRTYNFFFQPSLSCVLFRLIFCSTTGIDYLSLWRWGCFCFLVLCPHLTSWRRTRSLGIFFFFHVYGCVVVFGPLPGGPNS